jgi:hypothetical protein
VTAAAFGLSILRGRITTTPKVELNWNIEFEILGSFAFGHVVN